MVAVVEKIKKRYDIMDKKTVYRLTATAYVIDEDDYNGLEPDEKPDGTIMTEHYYRETYEEAVKLREALMAGEDPFYPNGFEHIEIDKVTDDFLA